ncbi:hypothetical protein M0811_00590 [Anaeramoeba ignava]|uniref:Counting factor associated protein D n=1 Tax=Anaeramoeba ignava TaxID=1746090 RepID=A0A9Q0LU20_ANAIG|nr:hypothetical protein M0811_00590 [Anaeramoeba ignava]
MSVYLIILFSILSITLADPTPPTWPEKYHVEFVFSLPYANLHETTTVDYDNTTIQERILFYNGLASEFLLETDTYDIIVTQTNQTCFKNMEPHATNITLIPMFPDLTQWTYIGQNVVRGFLCDSWQWIYTPDGFNKTNVYNFYVDTSSGQPIQYHMLGYDVVFGSHFDEYVLDYYTYIPNYVDPNAFTLPSICDHPHNNIPHQFGRNSRLLKKLFPTIPSKPDSLFESFMKKYSKNYESVDEFTKRKAIFYENYQYIEDFNQKNSHMQLAINHFADMTLDEFRKYMLIPKEIAAKQKEFPMETYQPQMKFSDLPTEFSWLDYGAVSPVKDQAVCGSCWAFSTVGAIEGQYFLATGELKLFSEQNVIDCSWNATHPSYGCDGSIQAFAYEAIKGMGGIELESDYPYLGITGYCGFSQEKRAAAIQSYYNITNSEEAVKEALYNMGPLAISYDAGHLSMVYYSSGVYSDKNCSSTNLDHSVLLVGWGDYPGTGEPYWLIKNSWSTHWGDNGYFYISRKNNMCGVTTQASFPVLQRIH